MTTATLSIGVDTSDAKGKILELRTMLEGMANASLSINADTLKQQIDKVYASKNGEGHKLTLRTNIGSLKEDLRLAIAQAANNNGNGHDIQLNVGAAIQGVTNALARFSYTFSDSQFLIKDTAFDGVADKISKSLVKVSTGALADKLGDEIGTSVGAYHRAAIQGMSKEITEELQASLRKANPVGASVKLGVNRKFLSDSLTDYLNTREFSVHLKPDEKFVSALATSVRNAVQAALAAPFNVSVAVGQTATKVTSESQFSPAMLTTMVSSLSSAITSTLTPALDRMALSVTDAVKAGRSSVGASTGQARFTRSQSARAADGSILRTSQSVDPGEAGPELTRLTLQALQSKSASKIDPRTLLGLPSRDEMKAEGSLIAAQLREGLQTESLKIRSAGRTDPRTLLGLPSRDEMKTAGSLIAAQMRDGLQTEALKAQSASRLDPRTLLGIPSRDEMKTAGSLIAAQMREGLQTEALKIQSAGRVDPRTLLGLPSRDEMKTAGSLIAAQMREGLQTEALKAKSAGRIDPRSLLGLPSRDEMKTAGALIAAQIKEGVQLDNLKAKSAPKIDPRTLLGLPSRDEMKNMGELIAAQMTKSHEKLAEKVGTSRGAMALWSQTANEAHSAARGLAGSMGALWLTWGSTIPLAAGAAIGATLRSVFVVGKELEYQLKFVSALSGEAAVGIERFGNALSGSMTAPTKAAGALRVLAQNGMSASEALMVLPDVLNLATAGEMELADAALTATGVMAAFDLKLSDIGRVGDVFAKAAALSNTSVNQMSEAMKQASTVSDQYHVTLEETAAALATMAQRNITGSAAGTAFRNMWVELATPTRKAREALKQLNLELFDQNNELKSMPVVLEQLRAATSQLNEKGRLTFLNDVFGERGAKAINAILSDFNTFSSVLEKLKNESQGFAQEISNALSETVQGKINKFVSEFQIGTAKAFEDSRVAVGNFVDALRDIVKSDEFRKFVSGLTQTLVDLGRVLLDQPATMAAVITAWMAGRVAATALTASIAALGAVSRVAIGFLTGGLGLLATLGATMFMLRERTDEGTAAREAYERAAQQQLKTAEELLKRYSDEITYLDQVNALLREGKTLQEARDQAKISAPKTDLEAEVVLLRERQRLVDSDLAKKRVSMQEGANSRDYKELEGLLTEQAQLRRVIEDKEQAIGVYAKAEAARLGAQARAAQSEITNAANEFNKAVELFNKENKKGVKVKLFADISALEKMAPEAAKKAVKSLQTEFNKLRDGSYKSPTEKAPKDTAADKLRHQRYSNAVSELKREEDQLKRTANARKQYNDVLYDPALFDESVRAVVAEYEAQRTNAEAIAQTEHALKKLAEQRKLAVGEAEIEKIENEIEARTHSIKVMQDEARQRSLLAEMVARNRAIKDASSFAADLNAIETHYSNMTEAHRAKMDDLAGKQSSAADKARLEFEKSVASGLVQREKQLETFRQARLRLAEELARAESNLARVTASTSVGPEAVENARVDRDAIVAAIDAQDRITAARQNELVALRARVDLLKESVASDALQVANAEAAKKAAEEWKEAFTDIGKTLVDIILDGGRDASKKLKELFKRVVLTPILNYAGAQVTQGLVGTAGEFLGGAGGNKYVQGAQTANTMYDWYNKGVDYAKGGYNWLFSSGVNVSEGSSIASMAQSSSTKAALYGDYGYGSYAGNIPTSAYAGGWQGSGMTEAGYTTFMEANLGAEAGSTTVGTAATSSTTSGAGASSAGLWIAAAIIGAMKANSDWKEGFRRDQARDVSDRYFGSFSSDFTPMGGIESAKANFLSKLGFSDRMADLLSGATAVSALMGYSKPQIIDQGVRGTISASGFSGEQFVTTKEKAGWVQRKLFGKDDRINDVAAGAAPDAITRFISDGAKGVMDQAKRFGKALSLPVEALDQVTSDVKISLSSKNIAELSDKYGEDLSRPFNELSENGKRIAKTAEFTEAIRADTDDNMKALGAAFSSYGEQLVAGWAEAVKPLAVYGETTVETINRLGSTLLGVNEVLLMIGQTAFESSVKGAAGAVELVKAFGGIQNFQQAAGQFIQEFYGESEAATLQMRTLGRTFSELGLQVPSTTQSYRALMEAQDLTTDVGQQTYVMLMANASAFKKVSDVIEKLNDGLATARESALKKLLPKGQERDDLDYLPLQRKLKQFDINTEISTLKNATPQQLLEVARAFENTAGASIEAKTAVWEVVGALAELKDQSEKENDIQEKRTELQIALLRAQGKETEAVALEQEGLLKTLRDLDPALAVLQQQVWDAARATEIANTSSNLNIELLKAQGRETEAVALERRAELDALRKLDPALAAVKQSIYDAVDAAQLLARKETLVDSFDSIAPDVIGGQDLANYYAQRIQYKLWKKGVTTDTDTILKTTPADLINVVDPSNLDAMEALADIFPMLKDLDDLLRGPARKMREDITNFRSNDLAGAIEEARFGTMKPADRIAAMKTREAELFSELDTTNDPVGVAQKLQKLIVDRIREEADLREKVDDQTKETLEKQISGLEKLQKLSADIRQFLGELSFGELSPLSPVNQLAASKSFYQDTLNRAKGGDENAIDNILSNAKAYLEEAAAAYASGPQYAAIYDRVTADLAALGIDSSGAGVSSQISVLKDQLKALDDISIDSSKMLEALTLIDSRLAGRLVGSPLTGDGGSAATVTGTLPSSVTTPPGVRSATTAQDTRLQAMSDSMSQVATNTAQLADVVAGQQAQMAIDREGFRLCVARLTAIEASQAEMLREMRLGEVPN